MKIFSILVLFIFMSCNSKETKCNNDFNIKGRVQNVEETTKYPNSETKSIYSLNEDDYVLSIEEYSMNNLIEKKNLNMIINLFKKLKLLILKEKKSQTVII